MRIGELAAASRVSARSLRYYEQQGLITSARSVGGQRRFAASDVDRVIFLQRMFTAGLSSRTIRELLPCVDAPSDATIEASRVRLVEERARLGSHIEDLLYARGQLDRLIDDNLASTVG